MSRPGLRTAASRGLAAAIAAAALLAGACAAGRPVVVEVGAPDGGAPYLRRHLPPGGTMTYRFIHSVSRTPVEETWTVERTPAGPALTLRAIRYRSTGAGLPAGVEDGGTFELTPRGFTITGLERAIGLPLDLRVTPSAANTLVVGGETIDLTRFPRASGSGPASLLRLRLH